MAGKSLYLSEDTEKKLQNFSDKYSDENFSLMIKRIVNDHIFIMQNSIPEFSKGEKLALCALFNNHALSESPEIECQGFIWNIYDGLKYDGNVIDILEQYDIDKESFQARCEKFTPAERLAKLAMCRAFWNNQ